MKKMTWPNSKTNCESSKLPSPGQGTVRRDSEIDSLPDLDQSVRVTSLDEIEVSHAAPNPSLPSELSPPKTTASAFQVPPPQHSTPKKGSIVYAC